MRRKEYGNTCFTLGAIEGRNARANREKSAEHRKEPEKTPETTPNNHSSKTVAIQ
jgi:hypothetical protein